MSLAMTKLQKMGEAEYSSFVRVLFGLSSPSPVAQDLQDADVGPVEWVDAALNDSQKDAIRFALASREIALVHGPPGVSTMCFLHAPLACHHTDFVEYPRQARRTPS